VALIKPFRALRPVPDKAEPVSCVPYDVVHESEVREFLREDPLTFLQVTRPDAGLSEEELPAAEAMRIAKENLQRFIDEGILVLENEPCIYIYRLAARTHTQTGIVACVSVDEYEQGRIKKHEKTRPDKVDDRMEHMLELRAQTGLIFLAFRGTELIHRLIEKAVTDEPLFDFPGIHDTQQTVWRIPAADADADAMIKAFAEVPALYIADGHHRAESAAKVREKLRSTNPEHNGSEDYNFFMAGMFPAEDLRILAYNRVVKDLNGSSSDGFLEKLTSHFVVAETKEKQPRDPRNFCMYLDGKWYALRFATDFLVAPPPNEALDVSILQRYLLEPVLGIGDVRTDTRIGFSGGGRGVEELERLVDSGEMRVAFSLFPTTMEDLFAVSDMNEIMPPKSTWFEPKLRDGLFVHRI
jgi:uncharacterized protein (DUF1015 family)